MFDPYETPQLNGNFRHFQVAKEEANYKLCRVKKVMRGPRGIPYAVTHDGRTVRYSRPRRQGTRHGEVGSRQVTDLLWIHGDLKPIEPSEMVVSWEPNGGLIKMSTYHIIHIWDEHPSKTALWVWKAKGFLSPG